MVASRSVFQGIVKEVLKKKKSSSERRETMHQQIIYLERKGRASEKSESAYFLFFQATLCGLWDLSSLTKDVTCAPCIGSTES